MNCRPYPTALNLGVNILSFICSLGMTIGCLHNWDSGQKFIQLVLGIAISDLIFSLSNLLFLMRGYFDSLCFTEAILKICSWNFSLLFAVAIAIFCARSFRRPYLRQSTYVKGVILIGSLMSLAMILPIIFLQQYVMVKDTGLFCVLAYHSGASDSQKLIVRTVYDGIPAVVYIIISLICYIRIRVSMNNLLGREARGRLQIFGYTFVMFLILVPRLIDNYLSIGDYHNCKFSGFLMFHLVLSYSAGTLNALVYRKTIVKRELLLDAEELL